MNGKKLVRGTILTALCMAAMLYGNAMVGKAYWVAVKADNTRVRNAASTESDVMTTVKAGERLEVVSEEQGSDGKVWYKVAINNVSGYVRSDTVEKDAGEGQASPSLTEQAPASPVAEASSSSVVEAMPSQAATVKTDNVNVRASASTKGKVVATLKSGAAVTLTGTASATGGKKWYQVNFINNGSNVTGFIREDFVEPGEVVEPTSPPEEAAAEGAAPADADAETPAESDAPNSDYELFFEADANGVDCWYIHDNVAQKRYKLEQLMQAGEMGIRNVEIKNKEISRLKIVLIVLAAIMVVAIAAAAFFGYKYFNARNDDDEEEDEEDDEDDDIRTAPSVRRRERVESERREESRGRDRSERETRRPEEGAQRSGGQRRPGSAQQTRQRPEEELRRRPGGDAARQRGAQLSDEGRAKNARPSGEARPRNARPSDEGRPRGGQSAPQARRPESAAPRKGGRADVEWKSKNFLAGDEDEMESPSFINGDEE